MSSAVVWVVVVVGASVDTRGDLLNRMRQLQPTIRSS
jgi:hypothetical protein